MTFLDLGEVALYEDVLCPSITSVLTYSRARDQLVLG